MSDPLNVCPMCESVHIQKLDTAENEWVCDDCGEFFAFPYIEPVHAEADEDHD